MEPDPVNTGTVTPENPSSDNMAAQSALQGHGMTNLWIWNHSVACRAGPAC